MKQILVVLALLFSMPAMASEPLKLAVAGVSHDHIANVVNGIHSGEFTVVGVYEKDGALLKKNALTGLVPDDVFYGDLGEMLDKTHPEAVVAYGSIYDHLEVVAQCAPRHIHVMVEKPLAVSVEHAIRMRDLASEYGIYVLTNYATNWYPANHQVASAVRSGELGQLFRLEFYDGHSGPIEIGCSKCFTDWLTDPVQNGGGAVVDFGCYGANLTTWLLNGQRPVDVYAVLQHNKPGVYPKVDDDATIILRYPSLTVQLSGSWCWPFGRMESYIYGLNGCLHQEDETHISVNGTRSDVPSSASPYSGCFSYLKAVVRGEAAVSDSDLSALENNLTVVGIIDAARRSAASGRAEKVIIPSDFYILTCIIHSLWDYADFRGSSGHNFSRSHTDFATITV